MGKIYKLNILIFLFDRQQYIVYSGPNKGNNNFLINNTTFKEKHYHYV
jgi:hypothetical protein